MDYLAQFRHFIFLTKLKLAAKLFLFFANLALLDKVASESELRKKEQSARPASFEVLVMSQLLVVELGLGVIRGHFLSHCLQKALVQ